MPILNANIRAFKSRRIAEITQFIFYNLNMYKHFILTRTVNVLFKSNDKLFLFYFLMYAHCTLTLCFTDE